MITTAEQYSLANNFPATIPEERYKRMTYGLSSAPFDLVSTLGRRMTGKIVLDAVVSGFGPKGTGKSEGELYIAEWLGKWLSLHHGLPASYFFTIDNVRSVDPDGTLKMFTSKQLIERPNQVLIIDDASISSNSRDFYKEGNKRLNAIITVARIYRHCVLLNTVSSNLIDAVLNQFSDYVLEFQGADEITETNEVKFFVVEQKPGRIRKNRDPYHKFLQYYDRKGRLCQITRMLLGRPSLKIREEYAAIRKENTDALVMNLFDDNKIEREEQQKLTKAQKKKNEAIEKFKPVIRKGQEEGKSIKAMMRETGLTEYRINQIIASMAMDVLGGKDE